MEVKEAIYTRRAVRDFTSETIDQSTISELIDEAIQAPSAMNEQSWSFSVVRDKDVLTRISKQSKQYMLHNLPSTIPASHIQEILTNPLYDIFYRAPVLIVISSTSQSQWNVENCALAAENLMLAACAAGLGTCWIGFAEFWLRTPEGKATLGLPASYTPVAPVILGYSKTTSPPVPRKNPEIKWIGD